MSAPHFHLLTVKRVSPEAAESAAITFGVPAALRDAFQFEPGQFLTLRATIAGQDVRRTYSISSPRSQYHRSGELEVGIRPVENGVFSNWATAQIRVGDTLQVMPPDGRFTVKKQRAIHRVGFAAGSGITPILSIAATTLEEQPDSKFTLVYGNRRMASVMFNEALQDLKDRFADRFTMVHILSRQAQEVDLLQGRIDADKVRALVATLLPARSMDEVFVCGPEAMIVATQDALVVAGVPESRIYTERFTSGPEVAAKVQADSDARAAQANKGKPIRMTVLLDGKHHVLMLSADESVLEAALNAGLDIPYSCKGGVCSTCRCKVTQGTVAMQKNFTLDAPDVAQGFALSCQAHATSDALEVSFDER